MPAPKNGPMTYSEEWWALRNNVGRCPTIRHKTKTRCRQPVITGGPVCEHHGGSTPQVKPAAAVRVAEAEARAVLAKMDIAPLADPIATLERVVAEAVAYYDLLKDRAQTLALADDMTVITTSQGEQLRAVLLAFERAADRVHRMITDGLKLGLDERRVRVDEAQAKLTLSKIGKVFATVLDHSALGLSSAQKDTARRLIAERLSDE